MIVKELNESESSDEVSKRHLVVKIIGIEPPMRKTIAANCLLAIEQPALRRQELYIGFCMELGTTALRCAVSALPVNGNSRYLTESRSVKSCGLNRSSAEVFVMKMERRV
jgi:hypothetical protein